MWEVSRAEPGGPAEPEQVHSNLERWEDLRETNSIPSVVLSSPPGTPSLSYD